MKRALAVVLAAAFIGLLAGGAVAQVAYYQVYFDSNWSQTSAAGCGTVGAYQNLYLVGHNINAYISAADFSVQFPPAMLFIADTPYAPDGPNDIAIGDAQSGEAVGWNLPQSGFSPLLLTTIIVQWTSQCSCSAPSSIVVGPYTGGSYPTPSYIRWPDYVQFPAVGMTSLVCPGPVAVQSKTWGSVKALYR